MKSSREHVYRLYILHSVAAISKQLYISCQRCRIIRETGRRDRLGAIFSQWPQVVTRTAASSGRIDNHGIYPGSFDLRMRLVS